MIYFQFSLPKSTKVCSRLKILFPEARLKNYLLDPRFDILVSEDVLTSSLDYSQLYIQEDPREAVEKDGMGSVSILRLSAI